MRDGENDLCIIVKTYPHISKKYTELVCTVAVTGEGEFVRLYPVPFRLMDPNKQYKKFSWIHVNIIKNSKDKRPESYRPDLDSLTAKIIGSTKKVNWEGRKELLFKNKIYTNKQDLLESFKDEDNPFSIAIFKPQKKDLKFLVTKEEERDWRPEDIKAIRERLSQLSLFETQEQLENALNLNIVKKLPYRFKYKFKDDQGKFSNLSILDWEVGALYWKCFGNTNKYASLTKRENEAIEKVKKMYGDKLVKKDLYFILGTTAEWHERALNPFTIIGVFYPPEVSEEQGTQMQLL